MKNWWRTWSYEIPLAFGDALWEVLVVQFADFLSRLTLRRVVEFVAIAILAMIRSQTPPVGFHSVSTAGRAIRSV